MLALLGSGCDKKRSVGRDGASAAAVTAASSAATGDAYDPSRMDYKSPPAVLSSERHTGPFATGDALNMEAALKPLVAVRGQGDSGSTPRTRSSRSRPA
jgi:nitrite reductase (NO-forming)